MPAGVEVVRGDFGEPTSVAEALAGATALFAVGVLGPDDAETDGALVTAARAAGVSRVVKLSAIGTGNPAVGPSGSWHLPGELAVRGSGLEWTVLRPSLFASNTLSWVDAIRAGQPVSDLTGSGTQGVVDPRDVSEVAAEVLLAPGHSGRTYTLTGPELLTTVDQAAALAEALGRPVDTVELSPEAAREQFLAAGMSEFFVQGVLAGTAFVRGGGNAVLTEDVRQVLGREPRTFARWARDHKEAFAQD
jgi:uncharacterized protein YbjT (DUF2867 family)